MAEIRINGVKRVPYWLGKKLKSIWLNGVKLWSGSPTLIADGSATALRASRYYNQPFANDAYLLISGGMVSGTSNDASDAFNTSLVKTNLNTLGYSDMRGATTPNYAFITGGRKQSGGVLSTIDSTVYAYNTSLVRTSYGMTNDRVSHASATTNNYAMFYGGRGRTSNSFTANSDVDAFNISNLTKTNLPNIEERYSHAGCGMGNKAIFVGGGYGSSSTNSLTNYTAISDSLVSLPTGSCTAYNYNLLPYGAYNGKYAIFCYSGDAFNDSLVKTTVSGLTNTFGAVSIVDGLSVFTTARQAITVNQDLVSVIVPNTTVTTNNQSTGRIGNYILSTDNYGTTTSVAKYKLT